MKQCVNMQLKTLVGLIKAEWTTCILAFACCQHIDFKIKIFQAFQLTKQQEFVADSIH